MDNIAERRLAALEQAKKFHTVGTSIETVLLTAGKIDVFLREAPATKQTERPPVA